MLPQVHQLETLLHAAEGTQPVKHIGEAVNRPADQIFTDILAVGAAPDGFHRLLPQVGHTGGGVNLGVAHHKGVAQIGVAAGFGGLFQYNYLFAGELTVAHRRYQAAAAGPQHHRIGLQGLGLGSRGDCSWSGL